MEPTGRFDVQRGGPDWQAVVRALQQSDITIGNLEAAMSNDGFPHEKLMTLRCDPAAAGDLSDIVDIVSLANNHIFDYGPEALRQTIALLDGANVLHVGAGMSVADATTAVVCDVSGLEIGVLAFSCLIPPGAAAAQSRPGIASIHVRTSYEIDPYFQMEEPGDPGAVSVRTCVDASDAESARALIGQLRASVDFVVVSVHWGYGAGNSLADYQRPLAHSFVDAGADVVYGNHMHAPNGIEIYRGRPIVYSPGLFLGRAVAPPDSTETTRMLYRVISPESIIVFLNVAGDTWSIEVVPVAIGGAETPALLTGAPRQSVVERVMAKSTGVQWEKMSGRTGTVKMEVRHDHPDGLA